MPGGVGGRAWGVRLSDGTLLLSWASPQPRRDPAWSAECSALVLREPGRWWESPQNQSKREERRPHQGLSQGCQWEGPAGHQEAQGGRQGSHCQLSGDTGVLAV